MLDADNILARMNKISEIRSSQVAAAVTVLVEEINRELAERDKQRKEPHGWQEGTVAHSVFLGELPE